MTITKVIKALYVKLGGSLTDTISGIANGAPVADYTVISDCVKALYVLYGGDLSEVYSGISDVAVKDYTTSAKAIAALAKVISKGITPTGKITITENGTDIDVAEYATADVNVFTYEDMFINLIDSSIVGVDIPTGISTIGDYKFYNCTDLSSVNIGSNIQTIGEYAFAGCTSLESIVIPTDMRYINQGAFDGCTSLTDIYYTGTQAQWEQITIGTGAIPAGATIHYEYTPA